MAKWALGIAWKIPTGMWSWADETGGEERAGYLTAALYNRARSVNASQNQNASGANQGATKLQHVGTWQH